MPIVFLNNSSSSNNEESEHNSEDNISQQFWKDDGISKKLSKTVLEYLNSYEKTSQDASLNDDQKRSKWSNTCSIYFMVKQKDTIVCKLVRNAKATLKTKESE